MAEFLRTDCPHCGRANVNRIDSLPTIRNVTTECAKCEIRFLSEWSRVEADAVGQECLDCAVVSGKPREPGKGCENCGSYRRAALALLPAGR